MVFGPAGNRRFLLSGRPQTRYSKPKCRANILVFKIRARKREPSGMVFWAAGAAQTSKSTISDRPQTRYSKPKCRANILVFKIRARKREHRPSNPVGEAGVPTGSAMTPPQGGLPLPILPALSRGAPAPGGALLIRYQFRDRFQFSRFWCPGGPGGAN